MTIRLPRVCWAFIARHPTEIAVGHGVSGFHLCHRHQSLAKAEKCFGRWRLSTRGVLAMLVRENGEDEWIVRYVYAGTKAPDGKITNGENP